MTLFGPAKTLKPYPFQVEAIEGLRGALRQGHKRIIFCLPTGGGKCHPAGTRVMTLQGYPIRVESVVPGMALMGPDSQPRYVKSVSRGYGPIFEVVPVKGEPWRCNLDHVLTLVRTPDGKSNRDGEVVDLGLREWMGWSDYQKHLHKLFRVGVDFSTALPQPITVEPYLVGLLTWSGY